MLLDDTFGDTIERLIANVASLIDRLRCSPASRLVTLAMRHSIRPRPMPLPIGLVTGGGVPEVPRVTA